MYFLYVYVNGFVKMIIEDVYVSLETNGSWKMYFIR